MNPPHGFIHWMNPWGGFIPLFHTIFQFHLLSTTQHIFFYSNEHDSGDTYTTPVVDIFYYNTTSSTTTRLLLKRRLLQLQLSFLFTRYASYRSPGTTARASLGTFAWMNPWGGLHYEMPEDQEQKSCFSEQYPRRWLDSKSATTEAGGDTSKFQAVWLAKKTAKNENSGPFSMRKSYTKLSKKVGGALVRALSSMKRVLPKRTLRRLSEIMENHALDRAADQYGVPKSLWTNVRRALVRNLAPVGSAVEGMKKSMTSVILDVKDRVFDGGKEAEARRRLAEEEARQARR